MNTWRTLTEFKNNLGVKISFLFDISSSKYNIVILLTVLLIKKIYWKN
jgi:hypothetical protein